MWGFDAFDARKLLAEAIAADPDFPLAYAPLSEAWTVSQVCSGLPLNR